jgi:membrane-associated phospholipid phosphatase
MSVSPIARALDTAALVGLRPRRRGVRQVAGLVSDGAKGGRVWIATSAVAAVSPRLRPAASDGLCGWAAASGAAFVIKAATDRRRPALAATGSTPRSSSMPSSHTAGAIAYVVAAGLRSPRMGLALVPAAGAVAWSRAATARHFPTDVAAGAVLGLLAGVATHHAAKAVRSARSKGDERSELGPGTPSVEPKMAVDSSAAVGG